ncbi:MAG: lactate racemase domain-containing protein, partial [Bacillota bacterium]
MLINLPYGKDAHKTISVPDQNLLGVLEPPTLTPVADESEAVRAAMAQPIESPRLKDLARPGMTVAISISDGSRPNIEKRTMPYVLQELRQAGIADGDITVIVGNGSHRPATDEEIRAMLGDEVDRLKVLNHFSDTSPLVHVGKTPDA